MKNKCEFSAFSAKFILRKILNSASFDDPIIQAFVVVIRNHNIAFFRSGRKQIMLHLQSAPVTYSDLFHDIEQTECFSQYNSQISARNYQLPSRWSRSRSYVMAQSVIVTIVIDHLTFKDVVRLDSCKNGCKYQKTFAYLA